MSFKTSTDIPPFGPEEGVKSLDDVRNFPVLSSLTKCWSGLTRLITTSSPSKSGSSYGSTSIRFIALTSLRDRHHQQEHLPNSLFPRNHFALREILLRQLNDSLGSLRHFGHLGHPTPHQNYSDATPPAEFHRSPALGREQAHHLDTDDPTCSPQKQHTGTKLGARHIHPNQPARRSTHPSGPLTH